MSEAQIRFSEPSDAAAIHAFIVELAVYEKEPDAVDATPASLQAQMESEHPPFECFIAEVDGEPVGMALFFTSYSTWRGTPGLYLEDLYVTPARRGTGTGLALLRRLAAETASRGYGRLDWQVLDWNQSAIDFYEAIGAEIKRDWIPCRLSEDALTIL